MDLTKEADRKNFSIGLQNEGYSRVFADNFVDHIGLIIENCPSCKDKPSCGLGSVDLKEQELKGKVRYFASKYKCPVWMDLYRVYDIEKEELYNPYEINMIELKTMNLAPPRKHGSMFEICSEMRRLEKLNS